MMNLTGAYLYSKWKNKIGMPYTAYVSPAVFNKLFEEALWQVMEAWYKQPQTEQEKDEMSQFIQTNVRITNIGNNSLNLRPIAITGLTYTGTAWTLQTNIPFSPQDTPSLIDIQGVTGFSNNPNGQFTVTGFTQSVKGTTTVTFTAPTGTSGAYNINTGYFSFQNTGNTIPNQLIDYLHLLNVRCKFTKPVYVPKVVSSTNGKPLMVTLNWYNNFRSSSVKNNVMVTMSGWNTNTAANGNFYIKKIGGNASGLYFQLFNDIALQDPVQGISNETNNNISLGLTYYNSARPYLSTEKISTQNIPTEKSPRYENANGLLKFYGDPFLEIPCTEVTADYICNPKLPYVLSLQNDIYSGTYVDANDSVFDCSTIYSEKLLYSTLDKLTVIVSGATRDQLLFSITQEQLQNNK